MYTEIEAQLNLITGNLKQEMIDARIIDEQDRVINVEEFKRILDKKIAQCQAILASTEKDGVTTDLYGANIAHARINWLETMKKHLSLQPQSEWQNEEEPGVDSVPNTAQEEKTNAFLRGISKLLRKFPFVGRTNSNENNR